MLLRKATRSASGLIGAVTTAISQLSSHSFDRGERASSCCSWRRRSRSVRRYTPLFATTSPSATIRVSATRVVRSAMPNSAPTLTSALTGRAGG